MDCQSKVSYAQDVFTFQNTSGNNNSSSENYSMECHTSSATKLRQCSGTLRLYSVHDWLLSFVLSHCNSSQGLNIFYEFNFTNGDFWETPKSEKEIEHILEKHLISFGLILLLFANGLYFARQLLKRDMLHRAYKLFMATLGYELAAMLFDAVHRIHYVRSGNDLSQLLTISALLHATSEIFLIVLLALLAFGWTITRAHLSRHTQMRLTIFFSVYILIYGTLFVLKQGQFFDSDGLSFSPTLYKLYRVLRIGNIILRVTAWTWFLYGAFSTVRHYPEKQKFYLFFAAFYSIWFLAPPLAVPVGSFFLDDWKAAEVYHRLDSLFCLLGFGGLFYIMRPSRANANFPFHVRSNEVEPVQEQNPLPNF